MTERRFVVDTNVLVSRLLLPGGVPARALDHALARGVLLVSESTLAELTLVLSRAKFDAYVSRKDRQQFLRKLGGVASVQRVGCIGCQFVRRSAPPCGVVERARCHSGRRACGPSLK